MPAPSSPPPGDKGPAPLIAGGRHRPYWKLTDDVMLRHTIKTERRNRRRQLRKGATKGICGGHTTEKVPYPSDYNREQAELRRRRPGLSGAAKRRKRKGGNPKGGPGQGGIQGAGRRLAATLKEARP